MTDGGVHPICLRMRCSTGSTRLQQPGISGAQHLCKLQVLDSLTFLDVYLHLTHWAYHDDARVDPARLRSTVALAVPGTRSFAATSCGSIQMPCLAATCNLPEEERATVAPVKLQLLFFALHCEEQHCNK